MRDFNISKLKIFLPWVIVLILLITNFFTYSNLNNKISLMENKNTITSVEAALESSGNAISIYEFSRYQYQEGAIDTQAVSLTLRNLISLHDKLIGMLNKNPKHGEVTDLMELTEDLLRARREGFSNLRSGVDLNSNNYNKVADQKFTEAEELKEKVLEELNKFYRQ